MRFLRTTTMLIASASVLALAPLSTTLAQEGTPTASYSCADVMADGPMGTPGMMEGRMAGMDMGTPMAGMGQMPMDLDQMYIDMMIPHHASIIAMAQAIAPRLSDPRLQEMAQAIIAAQEPEIAQLREYRQAWYGDDAMMMDGPMMEMMPGMSGTMAEMAFQMDAEAQVAAICAAENADLAFIDQTIPHHRMAIEASEVVLDHATHPEMREFAQRVIEAQQLEIDELTAIREELAAVATPTG